jgi:hypothetical protein
MAHASMSHGSKRSAASTRARAARRLLFKADRPRAIDLYIDYFGGAGLSPAAAGDDRCGEALLERLA